jgi:hypothetical protein
MGRFAGSGRYACNKTLAFEKERSENTRFQLAKILVQWKQETS